MMARYLFIVNGILKMGTPFLMFCAEKFSSSGVSAMWQGKLLGLSIFARNVPTYFRPRWHTPLRRKRNTLP
jgi:hypothetical protein